MELVNKLVSIYKENSFTNDPNRCEMIKLFVFLTEYMFKIGISAYLFACVPLFLTNIYFYFIKGELNPLVPLFIPGIDSNTYHGYIIHYVFHTIVILLGFVGSTCSDFFFAMLIINVPVMSNILKDNFDELNASMAQKKLNASIVHGKFINILLIYREKSQ